jgi:hypothetical protein
VLTGFSSSGQDIITGCFEHVIDSSGSIRDGKFVN